MKEGTMCFGLLRRAQFSPIKSCAAAMPAYKDIYQSKINFSKRQKIK
jgi:hypothetical protein